MTSFFEKRHGVIKFNDNEFEIAICAYNRPEYIVEWLDKCYEAAKIRNISISVYDSSTDDETRLLLR